MKLYAMTWPELREVDRQRTLVLAPLGACEQHGPHLPTFTDSLLVGRVADGVEHALPERVLRLPVMWLGASEHHLPFGATLTANVETHITLLVELAGPLLADGYRRLLFLNGHGGNTDTIRVALRRLQRQYPEALLSGAGYWQLADAEIAGLCEGPCKVALHACEMETSMMLAHRPDLVRMDQAADHYEPPPEALRGLFVARDMSQSTRNGTHGYPSFASAKKGQRLIDASVRRTTEACRELLETPLPALPAT